MRLRSGAIEQKRTSYNNAISNQFAVGTYEEMIPIGRFGDQL